MRNFIPSRVAVQNSGKEKYEELKAMYRLALVEYEEVLGREPVLISLVGCSSGKGNMKEADAVLRQSVDEEESFESVCFA